MPRFFVSEPNPIVLGLTGGGLAGGAASSIVGRWTLSTIETAATALTNGTCDVPVSVPIESVCLFSQIMASVISNSSTIRIALSIGGLVLGGLIGLSVHCNQKQRSNISYSSLADTAASAPAEVRITDTQQLLLEGDPETSETIRLLPRRP